MSFEMLPLRHVMLREVYANQETYNFKEPYQRRVDAWNLAKKKKLIDTFINGYSVPKIYGRLYSDGTVGIIDGIQRMSTWIQFRNDGFNLASDFVYLRDRTRNLSNMSYSDLPLDVKEHINAFVLHIEHVITNELDRIVEMFLRLNNGTGLNNAQKRHAILGYLMDHIRTISNEHKFFTDRVNFKNNLYQHEDVLTKLILLQYEGRIVDLDKEDLDHLVISNIYQSDRIDTVIGEVVTVLDFMERAFVSKDKLLGIFNATPIFYSLFNRYFEQSPQLLRNFIEEFEKLRKRNRRIRDGRVTALSEYDKLFGQRLNSQKSILNRTKIITRYADQFITQGSISLETTINIDDIVGQMDDPNIDRL